MSDFRERAAQIAAEWDRTAPATLADVPTAVRDWMRRAADVLREVSGTAQRQPDGLVCDCDEWHVGHIHTSRGLQPIEDDPDED